MPDAATSTDTPAYRKLRRRLVGYKRADVDGVLAEMETQLVELREQLMERSTTCEELEGDLERARREVRYWEDRQAFVETEVDRARTSADRMESEARSRAEEVERDAKERSLKMIDRVCGEANAILQHARDEAKEMSTRFQDDVVLAEQRIARLRIIELDLQKAVRSAINSFERGMQTLEAAAPSVHAVEEPQRARTLPTGSPTSTATIVPDFGRSRAAEAAARMNGSNTIVAGLERRDSDIDHDTESVDDTMAVLKPVTRR